MARIDARSRLGDYFVAFGLATRKAIKQACQGKGETQMLGQALVKAGICTYERCQQIALIEKHYKKTAAHLKQRGIVIILDQSTFIGDILVALGFITPEVKQEWLDYQASRRARGEDPGRLGELLVAQGACLAEQRDLAMQVQNWLRGV